MQLKEENKIDERKKRGDMEEELRRKWKTLEVRGAWVRVGSLCFHRCGAVRSRERERESQREREERFIEENGNGK